jgi:hypothetical protein
MVLVALLASSGSSQWQLKLCEKAKTLLSDLRVPFEVVDMEDKGKTEHAVPCSWIGRELSSIFHGRS